MYCREVHLFKDLITCKITMSLFKKKKKGATGRFTYLCFWLCQQQLEQLQKELNFLEEDIKRVEVKKQNSSPCACYKPEAMKLWGGTRTLSQRYRKLYVEQALGSWFGPIKPLSDMNIRKCPDNWVPSLSGVALSHMKNATGHSPFRHVCASGLTLAAHLQNI